MTGSYGEVINWLGNGGRPASSEFKDKQYRTGIEQPKAKKPFHKTGLQRWRIHVVNLAHKLIPSGMMGNCVEIGAGNGLAAAHLSGFASVDKVYALDYSRGAVFDAMPLSQPAVPGVNLNKLRRVFGHFDRMPAASMHRVLAFGALHNAPLLETAFQSIARSLTADGWLVCSDLAVRASTPARMQAEFSEAIVPNSRQRFGVDGVRFKDTSDYFRSVPDYVVAAQKAGLYVYPFVFDHRMRFATGRPSLKKSSEHFGLTSCYPWGASSRYDRLFMLCAKESPFKDVDPLGNTQVSVLHRIISRLFSEAPWV